MLAVSDWIVASVCGTVSSTVVARLEAGGALVGAGSAAAAVVWVDARSMSDLPALEQATAITAPAITTPDRMVPIKMVRFVIMVSPLVNSCTYSERAKMCFNILCASPCSYVDRWQWDAGHSILFNIAEDHGQYLKKNLQITKVYKKKRS